MLKWFHQINQEQENQPTLKQKQRKLKERNLNGEFSGFLEEVFDLDYDSNTYSASDISSITLSIFDIDGNLVRTYKYSSDDANITYSPHQIDENAIITIPYEIEIKDASI